MPDKNKLTTLSPELAEELSQHRRATLNVIETRKIVSQPSIRTWDNSIKWGWTTKTEENEYPTDKESNVYEIAIGKFKIGEDLHIAHLTPGKQDLEFEVSDPPVVVLGILYKPMGLLPKETIVRLIPIGNTYFIEPVIRYAEGFVTQGCTGAVITGSGSSKRVKYLTFKVELYMEELQEEGSHTEDEDISKRIDPPKLMPSGEIVEVIQRLAFTISTGDEVSILLKPDGSWGLIVVQCDG